MSPARTSRAGVDALQLIEEAVHLLRRAPGRVLAGYYLGSVPFILGLLYFWADMSRSAFAVRHCAGAAFGMALLYLWMKTWQAMMAGELMAFLRETPAPAAGVGAWLRLASVQAVIQSTAGLVLLFASLVMVPFGWAYAFYHNASVYGRQDPQLRRVIRHAARQARLWPWQNHTAVAILWLFGLAVFANLMTALVFVPELLRMFLGIETVFSYSGSAAMNTTFWAVNASLTYLCVNPLIKTVYVLRCFYGESVRTGADLRVELAGLRRAGRIAAAVILFMGFVPVGAASPPRPAETLTPGRGGDAAPTADSPDTLVIPAELDESIREVIDRPEYAWRMPREPVTGEKGFFVTMIDGLLRWTRNGMRTVARWLESVIDWFRDWLPDPRPDRGGGGTGIGWLGVVQRFAFILIAVAVCLLVIMGWRAWRQRQARVVVEAQPVPTVPDLEDESVLASELPADDWLQRAVELARQGELRLALRALYLANLAYLGQQELVVIAPHKSNAEYEHELRRHLAGDTDLAAAFHANVGVFERVWYGWHETTQSLIDEFNRNTERIRGGTAT